MTWRVFITRDETAVDGQRTWTTRVLAYPVSAFPNEAEARGYAQRVTSGSTDPTLEATIEGPPSPGSTGRLTDDTRHIGHAGLAAARAQLGHGA